MLDDNAIKVAVAEEQIKGLREQHKSLAEATNKRLDGIENTVNKRLDRIELSVKDILGTLNKSKGAYAVLIAASGAVSAAILYIISFVSSFFHLTPKM